jgi:ABC-type phosphate transport system substrate-binding protein
MSVARATAGVAAVAVLAIGARAEAQTDGGPVTCDSLTNPVFISGSSASQPVLQALANTIGTSVSIVYQNPDSCLGVADFLAGMPSTETMPSAVATNYLNPTTGKAVACTLTPATDIVDIAVSDVFAATCHQYTPAIPALGAGQVEIEGPIQAMTIAVPAASQGPASISAEAAYVVFGGDAQTAGTTIMSWNQSANIFTRPSTSGTLNMIGEAIGLAPASWANAALAATAPPQQRGSTGTMYTAIVTAATNVSNTIGILSDEGLIQKNAAQLALGVDGGTAGPTAKALYFQGTGQTCGYLPDSTASSFDKVNVREGRYDIWGPLHFIANVANGQPTGAHAAAVATVLNYFIATGANPDATLYTAGADAGTVDLAKKALITAEASPLVGGVVPWCAMHVMRTSEIGSEASFQPSGACGCFFEATTGSTLESYCRTCTTNADCTTAGLPACNYGYCEVQ